MGCDKMDYKKFSVIAIIFVVICTFSIVAVFSSDSAKNAGGDDACELQINTSGKWRLDLTVNGKYSSDEGVGSKTIKLNTTVDSASVTVNQYENGPTNVTLLKGDIVLKDGKSKGNGVETIYFYYQA